MDVDLEHAKDCDARPQTQSEPNSTSKQMTIPSPSASNNNNNTTPADASTSVQPPEPAAFIKSSQNFVSALRKMYDHNEALIFWNAVRDLKFMIRADVGEGDAETMCFDFVMLYDEEHDRFGTRAELMDLDHDGYYDEAEDLFFIDEIRLPRHPRFDDADVLGAMAMINKYYATRVCPCSKYMIKNGDAACTYCLMTTDAKGALEFSCPICLEKIFGCHAVCQPCCSNHLHRTCLDTWANESIDGARRCPLCRT